MAPPLLNLTGIMLTLGGAPLLEGADLIVAPGDKIALVGRNGSGKSTLLKIAAGVREPDGGEIFRQPGATIRYLEQEPDLSGHETVGAYVASGLGPGQEPYRAQYLIEALGLDAAAPPANLSGGEARRAALARVLAPEPDILLLDEPTNHLDLPAIEWLESELAALRGALVLISHDRRFLTDLTRATVWIDRGRTRRIDRGFGSFEAWRDQLLEEEEKERHKLDRRIVAEEHWVRYGVTARRKRNVGRMERLAGLRAERRDQRKQTGDVRISVAEARSSGAIVIEAEGLSKSYGDRPIVAGLDLRVLRGDRLGIVGPNGAGKTTLINLITGQMTPDAGRARLGASVEMASLDQKRLSLDPDAPLKDAIAAASGDYVTINGENRHIVSYLKDFLFTPEQARTPVGALSGGERARVALARALSLPSNLLVLDEPTNDLDLETLDLLQETLADYPGTVILVSHDRDFLDRVATSILVAEGEGRWIEYAGGYSDMLAQRGHGLGAPARPQRPDARPAAQPAPPPAAPGPQKKLSFKQKHALQTLPGLIASLEADKAEVQKKLSDPGLYARDPAAFAKAGETLSALEAKLGQAEEQWLELEILREQIEKA